MYDKDGRRNIEFVERAVDSLDDYEAAYEAAYGEPPRGAEVTSLGRELREILDEVGSCLSIVGPCLSPLPPCLSPLPVERRGCGGKDGGVASLMLLPLALRRRRKSILEQVSSALPADVLARLRQRPDADD